MPSQDTKCWRLRVPARIARAVLLYLLVIFALHVADPTPRFLGFRRATWLTLPTSSPSQARTILPKFLLPPALKPSQDGGATSPLHGVDLVAREAPRVAPPALVLDPGAAASPCVARAESRDRNGAGPPLRC